MALPDDHLFPQFYRGLVEKRDSRGLPYRFYTRYVPPIPPPTLDCSIYLYPTREDAEQGTRTGGSGCLVMVPMEGFEGSQPIGAAYAVTAKHVLKRGCTAIRLNSAEHEGATVLDLDAEAWIPHPSKRVDIAIAPLSISPDHRATPIPSTMAVGVEAPDRFAVGQDVFMVGRFITHEGRQQNLPTVRYGNVAQLPLETILTQDGGTSAFLVEMRSLSGYSGSPVFAYRQRPDLNKRKENDKWVTSLELVLLGIDVAHLADFKPVLEDDKQTPIRPFRYVEQNSGMACVAPAWFLTDLLFNNEEVVQMREDAEQAWREKHPPGSGAVLDAAEDEGEFDQFEDLTRKLVKVPKSELDEKLKEKD